MSELSWHVYILSVSDGSLYTGITTDPLRRIEEHRKGRRGAKYFRGKQPLDILFLESEHSRSSASQREYQIKKMTKHEKITLIEKSNKKQL
ncbi:GIY-YIG nuclease family protein [Porticoccaceae bacterium]|nr:GIY-YIG nuclease family protein [Porticoccaceae bacterium]